MKIDNGICVCCVCSLSMYLSDIWKGGRVDAPKATDSESTLSDNATIISTFRIRVDECDRLWVVDTGLADILGNPKQYAPAALVVYDLKTDKLIRRYTIPKSSVKAGTFFANVVSITH